MTLYRPSRCPFCDGLLTCESNNDLEAINNFWNCPTKLSYQLDENASPVSLSEYSVLAFGQQMLAEYVRFPKQIIKIFHKPLPTLSNGARAGTEIYTIELCRQYRAKWDDSKTIGLQDSPIIQAPCTVEPITQVRPVILWYNESTKIFDLGYPLEVVEQKLKLILTFL